MAIDHKKQKNSFGGRKYHQRVELSSGMNLPIVKTKSCIPGRGRANGETTWHSDCCHIFIDNYTQLQRHINRASLAFSRISHPFGSGEAKVNSPSPSSATHFPLTSRQNHISILRIVEENASNGLNSAVRSHCCRVQTWLPDLPWVECPTLLGNARENLGTG